VPSDFLNRKQASRRCWANLRRGHSTDYRLIEEELVGPSRRPAGALQAAWRGTRTRSVGPVKPRRTTPLISESATISPWVAAAQSIRSPRIVNQLISPVCVFCAFRIGIDLYNRCPSVSAKSLRRALRRFCFNPGFPFHPPGRRSHADESGASRTLHASPAEPVRIQFRRDALVSRWIDRKISRFRYRRSAALRSLMTYDLLT
jgi:hypothetical protein